MAFNKFTFLLALAATTFSVEANATDDIPQEKCYCIAKAGRNDCASGTHNCAGKSTTDFNCDDWKYVASNSCVDVGGSLVAGQSPKK